MKRIAVSVKKIVTNHEQRLENLAKKLVSRTRPPMRHRIYEKNSRAPKRAMFGSYPITVRIQSVYFVFTKGFHFLAFNVAVSKEQI